MKLFYMPGACSLSAHIVARELGLDFKLVKVDRQKKTDEGEDYLKLNPKGYVPALLLPSGRVLAEAPAVLQYLADQKPDTGFVPKAGTEERYVVQEWLTYLGTEIHKNFSPLFNSKAHQEWKDAARAAATKRLAWTGEQLGNKAYLMGDKMTIPDAYLFAMLRWAKSMSFDLKELKLDGYFERIIARPHVQEALKAEGLA